MYIIIQLYLSFLLFVNKKANIFEIIATFGELFRVAIFGNNIANYREILSPLSERLLLLELDMEKGVSMSKYWEIVK